MGAPCRVPLGASVQPPVPRWGCVTVAHPHASLPHRCPSAPSLPEGAQTRQRSCGVGGRHVSLMGMELWCPGAHGVGLRNPQ